ncbi:caspase family protein [Pelagibacteraceae bacterium]|nr:caspase family protein [Pelagibacteraceae bacterium]
MKNKLSKLIVIVLFSFIFSHNILLASNKFNQNVCASKSFNSSYKLIPQNQICNDDERQLIRNSPEFFEAFEYIKISEEVDRKADKKSVMIDASNNKRIYVGSNSASAGNNKNYIELASASTSKYITKKKSKNTKAIEDIENLYSNGLLSKAECVRAKQKVLKLSSNLKNICDNVTVKILHKDDKVKSIAASSPKYWCISFNRARYNYDLIPSYSPVSNQVGVCNITVYKKDYPNSYKNLYNYHGKNAYSHGLSQITAKKVVSLTSRDNIFKIENSKLVLNNNKKTNNYIVKKVKPKVNKKKVEKKILKKEPKVTQPKVFQPKITGLDKIAPTIKTKLKIVSNTPNFTIEGTVKDNKNYKQGPFLEVADTNVQFNKKSGKFSTKLYSPFSTQITLAATDLMGNRSEIVVDVIIKEETLVAKRMEKLNPSKMRKNRDTNKIALIIGIEKYDNVVSSSYSNLDAKYFTQYIKNVAHPNNIITLLDDKATRSGSLAALAKELRGRIIAGQSEVIIFFSGHGLAENEKDLYLLTNDSDQDLLEFTAIKRDQIIKLISSYKPKSVVMFLDTCYSGTSRKGEQLIASARPIRIKVNDDLNLPNNFSIFSASQASELSSGMDEEKQGIFSYYVMKGLEGNADENKDRKITNGELHNYLKNNVPRKALQLHSRNQNPTFKGVVDQVLLQY